MRNNLIITLLILLFSSSINEVSARCVVCFRHESGANNCVILWESSCSDGPVPSGESRKIGPWRFGCKDFRIISQDPVIQYDSKGKAVLIDGTVVTAIASDYLEREFKKINKKDSKIIEALLKKDDQVVSLKRLEDISKQLNAKMLKVEELPELNFSCCSPLPGDKAPPDETNITKNDQFGGATGGVVKVSSAIQWSIGTGFNKPSSLTQNSSNTLSDIQLLTDLYIPIAPISNNIDFGFSTSFQYSIGTGSYSTDGVNVYNIQGQASAPIKQARGSGSPRQAGFRGVVSPQLSIGKNRTILRGGFGFGYMSLTQQPMQVLQVSKNGSQTNEYKLLNQNETKINGIVLMPNLRVSHFWGRVGVWVEGQYSLGPQTKISATRFVPKGAANQNGNYTLSQMEEGTNVPFVNENVKYKSLGVNAGMSFNLGKPWFVKCLVCGRWHRLGHCRRSKFTDENLSQSIVSNKPRGKHYCLICGRRHRGKCKYGFTESSEVNELYKLINAACKGLYDGKSENCDAKTGVCCTDDFAVSNSYDLEKLDAVILKGSTEEIKNYILSSNLEKALGDAAKTELWVSILRAIKSGEITFEAINQNNAGKKQYLIKTVPSKNSNTKQERIGHVTLLK